MLGFLLLENFRHYCLDLQVCAAVEFAEVDGLGFEFLEDVPHVVEDAVGFRGPEAFDVLIGSVDHWGSSLYSRMRL